MHVIVARPAALVERTERLTSEAKRSYQPQKICKHRSEQSTWPHRLRTHTSQGFFFKSGSEIPTCTARPNTLKLACLQCYCLMLYGWS
jgi:hypothetical protein